MTRIWQRKPARPRLRPLNSHWSTTGLLGCWMLHTGAGPTAFDLSGYGNHGTLINMDPATDWVAGPDGPTLDFVRPSSQYVDIGNQAALNFGTGDFSIVASAYYTASTSYHNIILSQGDSSAGWMLYQGNGNEVRCVIAGAALGVACTEIFADYTHVVVVRQNDQCAMYINGLPRTLSIDEVSGKGNSATDTGNAMIGARQTPPDRFLDGRVSYVYPYNRALSAAEVLRLHETRGLIVLQPPSMGLWRYGEVAEGGVNVELAVAVAEAIGLQISPLGVAALEAATAQATASALPITVPAIEAVALAVAQGTATGLPISVPSIAALELAIATATAAGLPVALTTPSAVVLEVATATAAGLPITPGQIEAVALEVAQATAAGLPIVAIGVGAVELAVAQATARGIPIVLARLVGPIGCVGPATRLGPRATGRASRSMEISGPATRLGPRSEPS